MIYLKNDYSEGAHPKVLEALVQTNMEQHVGYGEDAHCKAAAELIKKRIGKPEADIHFLVGGTLTNMTAISAFLRPHEAVISSERGHICVHETGAVESTGHKIIHMKNHEAKLKAEQIHETMAFHCDEHMVKPKLVYLTQASELGTIYSKKELQEIRKACDKYGLYLYMDGARLATALTCEKNDLTIEEIAALTDAFYIGGTKNGILFGEALVINKPELKEDFRYHLKRKGGMLAKGRLLGIQFKALFQDDLYFELGKHANQMAAMLDKGLRDMGYEFMVDSPTNQLFPILPNKVYDGIVNKCALEDEAIITPETRAIRLCTSWATPEEDVLAFLKLVKSLT